MGVMYIGGNKVIPIFKETQIVPYPAYGVVINNPDEEHQEIIAQLEPFWKTKEYNETFIAGAENVGVKLHLYINTTAPGYAHGTMSWSPDTFVNGGEMDGPITVTATSATPIQEVVIPTGYEDYYLKNNISNFYNDTNYDSYKSKTQLTGKVIVFDLNNYLPTQTNININNMFQGSGITELDLSNLNTSKVKEMYAVFWNCPSLTYVNLNNWNTSNVTRLDSMFQNCTGLLSVDVNHFDTSNVIYFHQMFQGCSSLTSLDLSNLNTSKAESMNSMFISCSSLTSLDVSNFDTSNVTVMNQMFSGCTSLTSLDLSNWNTSNVTTMNSMFDGCSSLKILDLSNFDTTKVTNMNYMFQTCSSLQYLIIDSNTFKFKAKTSMSSMYLPNTCKILVPQALISTYQSATNWSTYANNFEPIENYNIVRTNGEVLVLPASLNDYYLKNNITDFYEDKNYTTSVTRTSLADDVIVFDLDNYLPSQSSVNMSGMFQNCQSLTSLDLNYLNTSKVTNMNSLFYGCSSLTSIDVSNFDTSNVTNMSQLFYECQSLTSIDVSNFDTSNVTDMLGMFQGCSSLTSIDVSNFDTSNVIYMNSLFYDCQSLTSLDLSHIDTSNVTDMLGMFDGCSSLTSIDVSNFDTSNVTYMGYMFDDCDSLQYLIIDSQTFKFIAKDEITLPSTCKILVPQALISTYQSASYWSEHASKFDAIENYNVVRANGQVIIVNSNVEDYYLKNNITDFYTDQTYTSYVSRGSLIGDVIVFDTNNYLKTTTSMQQMFNGCTSLTSLNVKYLDTSNITRMESVQSSKRRRLISG